MPTPKFTHEIITAAIVGFEEQKRRLDLQISELRAMLTGAPVAPPAAAPKPAKRGRRKMSAAGRKAIAEGQRKRWATAKVQPKAETPAPAKPKRKLSAAGRAAIIAATKKRWAAKRAAEAASQPAKKAAAKK